MTLSAEQLQALDEQGWFVARRVLAPPQIDHLRGRLEALWRLEGDRAGSENYIEPGVRRLANLADKGGLFRALALHPLVLEAARAVMGSGVRLSMLNAREIPPRSDDVAQPLHADTDYGRAPDGGGFFSLTAIWMLTPFTADNGAPRIVPGSHRFGGVPRDAMRDPKDRHPSEVRVLGAAGDLLVFNGHAWHAAEDNQSDAARLAILAHYLRSDVPRNRKRRPLLSARTLAALAPEDQVILGVGEGQWTARALGWGRERLIDAKAKFL